MWIYARVAGYLIIHAKSIAIFSAASLVLLFGFWLGVQRYWLEIGLKMPEESVAVAYRGREKVIRTIRSTVVFLLILLAASVSSLVTRWTVVGLIQDEYEKWKKQHSSIQAPVAEELDDFRL